MNTTDQHTQFLRAYAENLGTRLRSMEAGIQRLDDEHAQMTDGPTERARALENRVRCHRLHKDHQALSYTAQQAQRAAETAQATAQAPAEDQQVQEVAA